MPPPDRSRGLRRTAAIAAAGLTLLAAEGALRLLPTGLVVEPDLYRMEDGLLLLRPGIVRRHLTPLWDVTIRTDGEGFRDAGRELAPGEAVVLGLGDSQAFGWGVELEETFYSRMEAALDLRVVKAAVPGTGPTDQARMLARLMPLYRPRAVVLAFFAGNDFVDAARGGAAQYEVVDGFLTHRGEEGTRPGLARRLAVRSRLLQLLRAAQFRLGAAAAPERRWDEPMREYAEIHLRAPPVRTERAVEAALDALDDVAEQCRRSGVRLIVLAFPRSYQVYDSELEEMLAGLGWRREDLDLDRPQRILADWAAARGVALLDALPAFRAHAAAGGAPLFFTPDAHLTPDGHSVTAELVRRAL